MAQQIRESTTAIWSFNRRVSNRLMVWSVASILTGIAVRRGNEFRRALGTQFIAWGVIDAAIAAGGQFAAERKQANATPQVEVAQAQQLRRLLWFNAALDILYVAGGVFLFRSNPRNPTRKGHGAGIVVQGAFLLLFDFVHALRTPRFTHEQAEQPPNRTG